ncbi:MAG: Flp pilus assembly protein CpaB [Chloroflexota bacterium]
MLAARRRTGYVMIALGVFLGVLGFFVTFVFALRATARTGDIPMQPVVVAATDIPERTVIQPNQVRVIELPADRVPPTAVGSPTEAVGKFTLGRLYAGQLVVREGLADTGGNAGLAFAIPPGKVLVTVNFASAANTVASGTVRPGDRVDIIVYTEGDNGKQAAATFRNLEVFSVGGRTSALSGPAVQVQGPQPATVLQFVVSPQEALELKFLEGLGADLVLRAAGDPATPPLQVVDMDYMAAKYGLERPRR